MLFSDTKIKTSFIRPAYYFSNWAGYCDIARESGVLSSFFPLKLKIPMVAPHDVACFAADVITRKIDLEPLYEIYNDYYCAEDIARIMGSMLNRKLTVEVVSQDDWMAVLRQTGFSASGASNLAFMTEAVITGKTKPETRLIKLSIDFQNYLKDLLSSSQL